jgi:hypothetical protein
MAISYGFFSNGQSLDGFILLCAGGAALLAGVVYLTGWYENIDYGLTIIGSILGTAVAGGILGCIMYSVKGAVGGAILVGFVAEVVGVFCAFYLYHRDTKEARR